MSTKSPILPAALSCLALAATLSACRAVTETPEPVDWKVSWNPARVHEDNTPITKQPIYDLEMSAEGREGPWTVVWTGTDTQAVVKASPGTRCFRAMTVENGVRSKASEVICSTKSADGDSVRYAEKDSRSNPG